MQFNIKQLRYDLGLVQQDFAKSLKLPQSAISSMEKGYRRVTQEHIDELRKIYEFNPQDYMTDEPDKTEKPSTPKPNPAPTNQLSESDLLGLFERIHSNILSNSEKVYEAASARCDNSISQFQDLSSKIYELQERINSLQEENYNLKLKLIKHGIEV